MRNRTFFIILAVGAFLFFLIGNGALAITDPVESNYALTAKEMVLCGDWISPRIYGAFWYDKPVFLYWMLCLSYTVFGFTDFASRLPSAFFGAASIVLAAWFMLQQTGKKSLALLLAAMTATSLEVWLISHAIITDQILFFFTIGTMFLAYIGITKNRQACVIAAYAMAAGAVLTKGPVGIVLPGIFLLVFAALRHNLAYAKRLFPPLGIVLFLALGLLWYGPMYSRHGMDFVNGFLGFNNVVRATVSEHPEANVWYYYLVLVPLSLLPWTGPCLYALWQRRSRSDEYIYMAVWAIGTILFYTFMATKYPTYAYIANMPLLYIGALGIRSLYDWGSRKAWIIVTAPALLYWLLFFAAGLFAKPHFTMGSLLWLYVLLVPAMVLVLFAHWNRAYAAIPICIALTTAVTYILLTYQVMVPFMAYRSVQPMAAQASSWTEKIYYFEDYATSFVYYTGQTPVWTAPETYDESTRLKRSDIWNRKHVFPSENAVSVLYRLQQGEAIIMIVPDNRYEDFTHSEFAPFMKPVGVSNTNYIFHSM
ncbi:MAG: glycosyltransferase family 39 protein [Megasphaera sp.]|jgi:4-amino-4-deoxy-L-arabinose transferase-like glycosyltransferase|nr:glycosyltransferase family 39 protein [Megasphaera sp.]MCH4188181.1 glycosyltransferase family 39 protein [Megasphaera sp.]MCH4217917.1 glycosyltransferase family 39 protein [Megasphaera sp.]